MLGQVGGTGESHHISYWEGVYFNEGRTSLAKYEIKTTLLEFRRKG